MNGRETSAAAALFFSLLSIGVLLKVEDLPIAVGGAAACALLAALMMKKMIMQTVSEAEDNYQRLEAQFQQLRSKLSGEQINLLEKQNKLLEGMSKKLGGEENAGQTNVSNEIKAQLEALVEAQKYTTLEIEKIPARIDTQSEQAQESTETLVKAMQNIGEKFVILSEQNERVLEKLEDMNSVVTTGVKIVQVMGQLMKNPPGLKEVAHMSDVLDSVNEKLEKLDALENVEKIHTTMVDNGKSLDELLDGVRENIVSMTFQFEKSMAEFGEQLKGLAAETEKLVERIDAYNGLTKATLEQYSMLTEQDVQILQDLTRKLEVRG